MLRSIVDSLKTAPIFALDARDKISILVLLMNQLLTRLNFRDYISDCNENYYTTRSQIREVVRKENINDRLTSTSLQKISQARLDDYVTNGDDANSPSTPKNPDSPLNPYAPLKASTRHGTINHDEVI